MKYIRWNSTAYKEPLWLNFIDLFNCRDWSCLSFHEQITYIWLQATVNTLCICLVPYYSSLVHRLCTAFQCWTLKSGRAWHAKSHAVSHSVVKNNEQRRRKPQDFNTEVDCSKRSWESVIWTLKYICHFRGRFSAFWNHHSCECDESQLEPGSTHEAVICLPMKSAKST